MQRGTQAVVALCLVTLLQVRAEEPLLLHEVRKIYVRPMSGGLDQALIQKLLKWDAIKVAVKLEEADAVLIGNSDMRVIGSGGMTTSRVVGEVTLVDQNTSRPIWSIKKKSKGLPKLADHIVKRLRKDWEESAKSQERQDNQH